MQGAGEIILPLSLFLLVVVLVEHLARRWALPTAGLLLVVGLGYGFVRRFGLAWLPDAALPPDVVVFAFLPVLIFSSSRKLTVRALVTEWPEITYLSLIGPGVSMVLLALPLVLWDGMGWLHGLLFGHAFPAVGRGGPRSWLHVLSASDLRGGLSVALLLSLSAFLPNGGHRSEALTAEAAEMILPPWSDEEGKRALFRNLRRLNPEYTQAIAGELQDLSRETLILWGRHDPFQKPAYAQRLCDVIPQAAVKYFEQAAHWIMEEKPTEVAAALRRFLDQSGNC